MANAAPEPFFGVVREPTPHPSVYLRRGVPSSHCSSEYGSKVESRNDDGEDRIKRTGSVVPVHHRAQYTEVRELLTTLSVKHHVEFTKHRRWYFLLIVPAALISSFLAVSPGVVDKGDSDVLVVTLSSLSCVLLALLALSKSQSLMDAHENAVKVFERLRLDLEIAYHIRCERSSFVDNVKQECKEIKELLRNFTEQLEKAIASCPPLKSDKGKLGSSWSCCIAPRGGTDQIKQLSEEGQSEVHGTATSCDLFRECGTLPWPCKERHLRLDQRFHESEGDHLCNHMEGHVGHHSEQQIEDLRAEVLGHIKKLVDVLGSEQGDTQHHTQHHVQSQVALLNRVVKAFGRSEVIHAASSPADTTGRTPGADSRRGAPKEPTQILDETPLLISIPVRDLSRATDELTQILVNEEADDVRLPGQSVPDVAPARKELAAESDAPVLIGREAGRGQGTSVGDSDRAGVWEKDRARELDRVSGHEFRRALAAGSDAPHMMGRDEQSRRSSIYDWPSLGSWTHERF